MPEPHSRAHPKPNVKQIILGSELAHYPRRYQTFRRWLPLTLGALAILTSITLTLILYLEVRSIIAVHGRAIILGPIMIPLGAYVLLFILGLILFLLAAAHWHDRIQVFELGLLKKNAKHEQAWSFEATHNFDSTITQVMFSGSIVTTRIKIRFEDQEGNPLVIRNRYENMMDLINTIREQVLPGYIKRARQRVKQGETVSFHPGLHATPDGLKIKGQTIPFDAVIALINKQTVNIQNKDLPEKMLFRAPITRIKNLDLLIDLLENPIQETDQSSPR